MLTTRFLALVCKREIIYCQPVQDNQTHVRVCMLLSSCLAALESSLALHSTTSAQPSAMAAASTSSAVFLVPGRRT